MMAAAARHLEPLTPQEFSDLFRAVRMQGGRRSKDECSPRPITFGDAEDAQPGGAWTCGCGRARKLSLQYERADGHTQNYYACADCDAVALQPRFQE